MLEQECFNFTHTPDNEKIKYLLFRHYRRERTNLFGVDLTAQDRKHYLNQLQLLADFPISTSSEFGVKMVVALSFAKPSEFFRRCANNGQLQQYFPELFNCIGCKQDPHYHQDDVFDHTMLALDKVEDPEVIENSVGLLDIKLAVLFHDIGKPVVRRITIVE
jgi:hypothetical protein